MILYLDTSSLVKLYVTEAGSEQVRALVDGADVISTSVVAFPEARSALARLAREGTLTPEELASARDDLFQDWESFLKIRVLKRVYERAGDLVEQHGLRGFDALHLASFQDLLSQSEDDDVEFSAFDARLNEAAKAVKANHAG
ncbi:MAG TPA: type II toxin-antitoxin system VapC family toxin [Acidimicrobiia bacterium]|nr:type II toxin-antitoxin system VapC family toxin [Acidimicrobiia bacterium]